jgi:hypothetical protein
VEENKPNNGSDDCRTDLKSWFSVSICILPGTQASTMKRTKLPVVATQAILWIARWRRRRIPPIPSRYTASNSSPCSPTYTFLWHRLLASVVVLPQSSSVALLLELSGQGKSVCVA